MASVGPFSSIAAAVAAGYGGYQGWTNVDSMNADIAAGNAQGKYTGSNNNTTTQQSNTNNEVNSQQTLNAAMVQENQPAIQTLQSAMGQNSTQYQTILGQIANTATQAEDATLAARGINPQSSGYAQQQVAGAVQNAQNPTMAAQLGYDQATQSAIAQLQTGNQTAALNAAQNLTTTPTQQSTINLQGAQANASQLQANYIPTAYGVYNLTTGQYVPYSSAMTGAAQANAPQTGNTVNISG